MWEQNNHSGCGTHQYALKKEMEELRWQETYGKQFPAVVDTMNRLLEHADTDANAAASLKGMFLNQEIFEHYKQVDEYAYMFLVMNIYEEEEKQGVTQMILRQGRTVGQLVDYLFEIKMILFRFDFEIDDAGAELVSFLLSHETSVHTLEFMMNTSAARPLKTALKLERLFEDAQMSDFEAMILRFIEKQFKGNYRVRKKLLDKYPSKLEPQEADRYRRSIQKVVAAGESEGAAPALLQLQELMWSLFYLEPEAEKEIASYLNDNKISNELFALLLEESTVRSEEYYFLIVDALLNARQFEKVETVLHFVFKNKPQTELAERILRFCGQSKKEETPKRL